MLINEVLKCSFSSWYTILGHLSIDSDIVSIDDEFREYILSDGIILPKSCICELEGIAEGELEEDDQEEEESILPEFPCIESQIKGSLKHHVSIFPKLNWSSCEDSRWIQATGTKCTNLSEVFLLLKSSDKIVHDLTEPFQYCSDYDEKNPPKIQYELILRKWININPSMEFRCFIAKNEIIGICQRDVRSFFEHIKKEKDTIIQDILYFFREKICNNFLIENFVIDVYRPRPGSIILIDVNPFGQITDSLLFDWDELRSKANAPVPPNFKDFRFIEERSCIQTQRFELNSLPLDVFNGNIFLDR